MYALYVALGLAAFVGVLLIVAGWDDRRRGEWKSIREREQVNAALCSRGSRFLTGEDLPDSARSQSRAKADPSLPAVPRHGAAGSFDWPAQPTTAAGRRAGQPYRGRAW